MRTIAIINQKGGCGKTTTSINLAACMARLGQKTLLVDIDPQGHCAVGLAVPEEQIERTIFDAMIEERDGKPVRLVDTVWQIATDFDLSPSNIRLAAFEQLFSGRQGREDRLAKAIAPVKLNYKWCIIDCPPSVGLLTFNALRACDEVIVPVETGYFSLHGLTKMMQTLEVLREKCGHEILIRVLPTLYDTRTKLAREVLSELRNKFREYLMESTVNFNTKLKEAASFGQPITEYDPGSRGYKDFVNLARELMGHRPTEVEPIPVDQLSRPAELVQRAKQLAQLTNIQFGRGIVSMPSTPSISVPPAPAPAPEPAPAPVFRFSSAPSVPSPEPMSSPVFRLDTAPIGGRIASLAIDDDQTENSRTLLQNSRLIFTSPAPIEPPPMPLMPSAATSITPSTTFSMISAPKTTAQKIAEFYGVKQVGDEVIFAARFANAKKVLIAGDFNNWSPMSTPMSVNGTPGEFRTSLPLPPGRYRYRLVVDGRWMTDPNNEYVETNQFGEMNNIIEVA